MNKFIFSGRLVGDPEIKQTQSGMSVCDFSVAVDDFEASDKKTDFFDCVCFNKTADFVSRYFKKGNGILVTDAKVKQNKFTAKDGMKIEKIKVQVNSVEFPPRVVPKDQLDADTAPSVPVYRQTMVPNYEQDPSDDGLPF